MSGIYAVKFPNKIQEYKEDGHQLKLSNPERDPAAAAILFFTK